MAYPSQASVPWVQPAFFADNRNVVSANAANPSGAGSAMPLTAGGTESRVCISSVMTTSSPERCTHESPIDEVARGSPFAPTATSTGADQGMCTPQLLHQAQIADR